MSNDKYAQPFNAGIPGLPLANQPSNLLAALKLIQTNGSTSGAASTRDAGAGTYDFTLAANRTLNVFLSLDNGGKYNQKFTFTLTGATPAAVTAAEIAAILNANTELAKYLTFSNSAGTLRFVMKHWSSRCKVYFTGTAGAVLGGIYATAIAAGSALGGSAQAGALLEFEAQNFAGNPVPNCPVYITSDRATSAVGLPTKGSAVSGPGYSAVEFLTDADGRLAFYLIDTTAEVATITANIGGNGAMGAKLGTTTTSTAA